MEKEFYELVRTVVVGGMRFNVVAAESASKLEMLKERDKRSKANKDPNISFKVRKKNY